MLYIEGTHAEGALMNRAKSRFALVALAVLALGSACTKSKDTEDFVPSDRGAVQPDGAGALLSEASACTELKAAEAAARAALGCAAVTRECPGFIRPAGGEACFEYSQASLKGCESLYDSFSSCDDFALHPCLISALSKCAAGAAGGAPGAAGSSSDAGAAGEGGAGGG
ncbi:MAG TPA: hypothetical protein VGJ91_02635 [Polyangiaceae bacterium]|jgi:hypothetical protein